MTTFNIPGEPVPKGRPRFAVIKGKTHTYTPAKTLAAEQEIAYRIRAAHSGPAIEGPVHVALAFYCKSKRSDIDNLTKTILDAANGIAWIDDRQVTHLVVTVHRESKDPHTEITMREIDVQEVREAA